jgi:hypothetical protein
MSSSVVTSKFPLAIAYLGTTVLGLYVSSPYHSFATKALFMAIPPVALFASRVRRSATTEVAAITETTAEFAPVAPADFDSFGFDALDFDIISRAS